MQIVYSLDVYKSWNQLYNIFGIFGGTVWLADLAIFPPVLGFLITNHLALLVNTFNIIMWLGFLFMCTAFSSYFEHC